MPQISDQEYAEYQRLKAGGASGQQPAPQPMPTTQPQAPVQQNGNVRTHADGGQWRWDADPNNPTGGQWTPQNAQAASEQGRQSFVSRPPDAWANDPTKELFKNPDGSWNYRQKGAGTLTAAPAVPPGAAQASAIGQAQQTMGGEAVYQPGGYWAPGPGKSLDAPGMQRVGAAATAAGVRGAVPVVQPQAPQPMAPAAPAPVPQTTLVPPVALSQYNPDIQNQAALRARQVTPPVRQLSAEAQAQQAQPMAPAGAPKPVPPVPAPPQVRPVAAPQVTVTGGTQGAADEVVTRNADGSITFTGPEGTRVIPPPPPPKVIPATPPLPLPPSAAPKLPSRRL